VAMCNPILLHRGDDIKWNHDLYSKLSNTFNIRRSYSMGRELKQALKGKKFGDFSAIHQPFWNTGGKMSPWNSELMLVPSQRSKAAICCYRFYHSNSFPASCKIYASAGDGFDWVDTLAMAKKSVIYCNTGAACTGSVVGVAIWLIPSTFRAFIWSHTAARSCNPARLSNAQKNIAANTSNPNGNSLRIISLDKIGFRIAQKAHQSFGMKILYNDIRQLPFSIENEVEAGFYQNLDDMLTVVDCVLVATPFGGEVVLNDEKIGKMKRGARLINIARGKLIDKDALIEALESGHPGAADLDVHFKEPAVNKKLADIRDVEMLSHTVGASVDSHIIFERLGMENTLSYFETGKAVTPVNLQFFGARTKL
jgi:lactate dehydrogenase-like 2-hydroxyacid dehydrogenase